MPQKQLQCVIKLIMEDRHLVMAHFVISLSTSGGLPRLACPLAFLLPLCPDINVFACDSMRYSQCLRQCLYQKPKGKSWNVSFCEFLSDDLWVVFV
uniref:Uncharacterized protein n=1 Tax=Arundo donax TaxID=35708 RepID=A0A0A8YBM6_ARUDO